MIKKLSNLTKALVGSFIIHIAFVLVHFEEEIKESAQKWEKNEIHIVLTKNEDEALKGEIQEKLKNENDQTSDEFQIVKKFDSIEQKEKEEEELSRLTKEVEDLLTISSKNWTEEKQEEILNLKEDFELLKNNKKMFIAEKSSNWNSMNLWIEGWQDKIEEKGSKILLTLLSDEKGSVIATVGIRKDGTIESVVIDESSGIKGLDLMVKKIVNESGPFERFSFEMSEKLDILYITRRWIFNGKREFNLENHSDK